MDSWEVYPRIAAAVGTKAVEQKVARIEKTYEELEENAKKLIQEAREMTDLLMEKGIIPAPPED